MDTPFFILSNKGESQIIVTKNAPILVPKVLFDPQHVEDYLKVQFDLSNVGHIFYNEIDSYISISYLDKTENACLLQLEPRCYQHVTTLLHRIIHRPNFHKALHSFALSVQDERILFFVEKENRLLLVNEISITSDYDILYHILNILKQYDIPTSSCMVYLHNGSEELASLINQYVDVTLLKLT